MIKIERTEDFELVKNIVYALWDEVSVDGATKENYECNRDNIYLLVRNNEDVLGVYILHAFNNATLEVHANVLKEHRQKHTLDISDAIHSWIKENINPEIFPKMMARVPEIYPNVIAYIIKSGWKVEGVMEKSIKINDQLLDLYLFGKKTKDL